MNQKEKKAKVSKPQPKKTAQTKVVTTTPISTVPPTEKKCPTCGKILPLASFPHDKHRKDGLYIYCRDCESLRQKAKNGKKAQLKLENEGYPVLIVESNEENGTLTETTFFEEEQPIIA
jgi:hypothetical protein